MKKFLLFVVLCVCGPSVVSAATVFPENTDEVLLNPDMGLVFFHYSNRQWAYGQLQPRGDTLDWFPGTGCVYFRLPWCVLEPEEGKYRWDIIDTYARPWIAAGKQIGLRVTCCEARFPFATPEWVRNAGAKGWFFKESPMHEIFGRQPATDDLLWEPDYGDPIFLEKLEKFLRAMAARYDGKPYLAFVDVGSVGMYGEGHTRAYRPELEKQGRDIESAYHQHYEIYRRCFPNSTVLCIDDQAGGVNRHPDPPLMRHARELGFGFRDDSILVNKPPKGWFHDNWARLFADNAPVFIEHEHYNLSAERGAWSEEGLLKSVEDNRATWLSLHGWPTELKEKCGDAFRKAALRLGYRFELRKAEFPDKVTLGERVRLATTWVNVGVAKRYKGAFLTWTLLDEQGRVAWSWTDESFDFKDALPKIDGVEHPVKLETSAVFGAPGEIPTMNDGVWIYMQTKEVGSFATDSSIPTLTPGRYTLAVSLGDRAGVPEINLPLKQGHSRLYSLGPIDILPAIR